MKDINIHCVSGLELNLNIQHEKQIELYVDDLTALSDTSDNIKVLVLVEPEEIAPYSPQVIKNHKRVDYILTHNERILEKCDNAYLFEFGTTWIDDDYKFPEKEFSVSHLTGFKVWTKGHGMRQKVWKLQEEIKIPKNFYLSKHNSGINNFANAPILDESKDPLFVSQFHITIENVRRKHWFTEKLIDAFLTKTVPIYWGAPDIGKYFDVGGMIIVDNITDLFDKINQLTPEVYSKMLFSVEENYKRAKEYAYISPRMEKLLKQIIK